MRLLSWLVILSAVCLLSSTLLPRYLPVYVRPDLFAVLLIFLIARAESGEVIAFSWLIGLAKDLFSAGPLGGYALTYLACAGALLMLRGMLNTRLVSIFMPLSCGVAFATEFAYACALGVNGDWTDGIAVASILSAALVTSAVAPLVVGLLDGVQAWLGVKRAHQGAPEGGYSRV